MHLAEATRRACVPSNRDPAQRAARGGFLRTQCGEFRARLAKTRRSPPTASRGRDMPSRSAIPNPGAAKNAVGEIVQQLQISGCRIWRKAAVAHHLRGDSLCHFLAAVFEHLKIRVAMRIDKARRDGQAPAVDDARIRRGLEGVELGDRLAGNEEIAAAWWRAGTINQCAASQIGFVPRRLDLSSLGVPRI